MKFQNAAIAASAATLLQSPKEDSQKTNLQTYEKLLHLLSSQKLPGYGQSIFVSDLRRL
jgi:hypothetical protein